MRSFILNGIFRWHSINGLMQSDDEFRRFELITGFTQTLDKHLKALQEKNLTSFLETINQHGELSLVFPNGRLLTGAAEVIDFHREWFSDPDWSIQAEIVRKLETSELAFALLRVIYDDVNHAGQPISKHFFLNLIFQRQGENWLLVHDQNTDIAL